MKSSPRSGPAKQSYASSSINVDPIAGGVRTMMDTVETGADASSPRYAVGCAGSVADVKWLSSTMGSLGEPVLLRRLR